MNEEIRFLNNLFEVALFIFFIAQYLKYRDKYEYLKGKISDIKNSDVPIELIEIYKILNKKLKINGSPVDVVKELCKYYQLDFLEYQLQNPYMAIADIMYFNSDAKGTAFEQLEYIRDFYGIEDGEITVTSTEYLSAKAYLKTKSAKDLEDCLSIITIPKKEYYKLKLKSKQKQ